MIMKNFNVTLPIIFLIFHVVPIYGFTGLSYGSCSTVLKKMLRYHPYKISVVQSLIPPDYLQRVRFCNWFNEIMNNDILDNTFFSDEGWFHLDGYVNKQNYRIWSGENHHAVRTATLHPVKVGVWLAVSRQRVYGPVFFNFTVNSERYIQYMLQPFLNQLTDQERQIGYFQQDSARAHTARATMRYLYQNFGDRVISEGVWPSRSPDLTPLDFSLFGFLKDNVFRNVLHTAEELQAAIIQEVGNITPNMLVNVFESLKRRVNLCLEQNGGHFEHYL
jgi:hypothetical protein